MAENLVDQVARDLAAQALAAISAHQSVCDERQKRIDDRLEIAQQQRTKLEMLISSGDTNLQQSLQTLQNSLHILHRQNLAASIALNFILLSVTGFLIAKTVF